MTAQQVDAFRFTGRFIRKLVLERIDAAPPPAAIPWTAVRKPVAESRIALVSTAGISMKTDPPFDMDRERAEPTWGDPGWRRISAQATAVDVAVNHLHIDTRYIESDINVALPAQRLEELVGAGLVGAAAPQHYSIMGYQGTDSSSLENISAPAIARGMLADEVDLAVLAPV